MVSLAPGPGPEPMKLLSRRRLKRERMKKIEAIIKPFTLDEVRACLVELGIQGMTVSEVRDFVRPKGHEETHHGSESSVGFAPQIKIETVVPAHLAEAAVEAILAAAQTKPIGDGKVFISDIDDAVRIRTAERGARAL